MRPMMPTARSALDDLEQRLGRRWENIRRAQQTTAERRRSLEQLFRERAARITCVVYFGWIARAEMTSVSDSDWILLIDGQAFPEHQNQTADVGRLLHENGFGEPGRSGVCGCM